MVNSHTTGSILTLLETLVDLEFIHRSAFKWSDHKEKLAAVAAQGVRRVWRWYYMSRDGGDRIDWRDYDG